MPGPLLEKASLWRDTELGLKSRLTSEAHKPAVDRDIPQVQLDAKLQRGDLSQKARLRFYPSIDVDYDRLFAGKVDAGLEEATDALRALGFRNNPTAYVEVTDQYGPDDGSYSRQFITETGRRFDRPVLLNRPTLLHRLKRQIHITVYLINGETHFLAHEEKSAWLQPARHVAVNDVSARIGVRDFRDVWFDEFGEELGGKNQVRWDTTH